MTRWIARSSLVYFLFFPNKSPKTNILLIQTAGVLLLEVARKSFKTTRLAANWDSRPKVQTKNTRNSTNHAPTATHEGTAGRHSWQQRSCKVWEILIKSSSRRVCKQTSRHVYMPQAHRRIFCFSRPRHNLFQDLHCSYTPSATRKVASSSQYP